MRYVPPAGMNAAFIVFAANTVSPPIFAGSKFFVNRIAVGIVLYRVEK